MRIKRDLSLGIDILSELFWVPIILNHSQKNKVCIVQKYFQWVSHKVFKVVCSNLLKLLNISTVVFRFKQGAKEE